MPAAGGAAPPGQLVFERATDADPDWTIQETPLGRRRQALPRDGSPTGSRRAITPHGGGLLVGRTRRGRTGKQIVVLARDPGGRFQSAARTARGRAARRRAGRRRTERRGACRREGTGAVADAAVENGSHTEAYLRRARAQPRDSRVVALGRERWSREPVELPGGLHGLLSDRRDRRQLAAEHVAARQGQRRTAGSGPMLFKRDEVKAGESRWQPAPLGAAAVRRPRTRPRADVSELGAAGRRGPAADRHRKRACGSTATCRRPAAAATGMTSRSTTTSPRPRSPAVGATRTTASGEALCDTPARRALRAAGRLSQLRLRRPRLSARGSSPTRCSRAATTRPTWAAT